MVFKRRFLFFFRSALAVALVVNESCAASNEFTNRTNDGRLDLDDILPKNYHKLVAPVVERGPNKYDPVIVKHRIYIYGIDSIREASMSFVADVLISQTWTDHRLNYPDDVLLNQSMLSLDWFEEIWHPYVYVSNAKSIRLQVIPVPNRILSFRRDKAITHQLRLSLELTCVMDFALYPHDRHECKIQLESLGLPDYEMKLEWNTQPVRIQNVIQLPQLVLVKAIPRKSSRLVLSANPANYTSLEVVISLKRNMGYYLINTYIPTCLIVMVSWIAFFIKPEALPARVTLGVTTLLTILTQHSKSQESLPRVSYLKVVDAFMLSSVIFIFLPLVEMCVVIMILYGFGTSRKMSVTENSFEYLEAKVSNAPRMHCIEMNQPLHSSIQTLDCISSDADPSFVLNINSNSFAHRQRQALKMDIISRMLFPTLFIVLNCVYWFYAIFLL